MGIERKALLGKAGVAALIAGLAACSPADDADEVVAAATGDTTPVSSGPGESGGEGEGEGGAESGGEFGIDPTAAASDPVTYLTALEVMRAHYLAGLAAFESDRRAHGAEMFTHPISEIYVDFEPVLAEHGVPDFFDALVAASEAPFDGSSDDQVRANVDAVLGYIDMAVGFAPESETASELVQARVIANMLERSALQYAFAQQTDRPNAPYLDGYGFFKAADEIFGRHQSAISASDPEVANALAAAVEAQAAAYATVIAPEPLDADSNALIELVRAAMAAAQN